MAKTVKQKIYAVITENENGTFNSWGEASAFIKGKKGVRHKSFSTPEEAEDFLAGISGEERALQEAKEKGIPICYVDGSYSDGGSVDGEKLGGGRRYSFGCVVITPEGEVVCERGGGNSPEALTSRNVAGELQGAMFAVKWAHDNGYKRIIIRHDYEGIGKWARGEWRSSSYVAGKYIEFMNKYKKKVSVTFEKVTAHRGNHYNEMADTLAKEALSDS